MRNISRIEIQNFSIEQLAGVFLKKKREIDDSSVSYHKGSITSILSNEIAPVCLGLDVKNGLIRHQGGGASTYAGDRLPDNMRQKFQEAIYYLEQNQFIRFNSSSREYFVLTDLGRYVVIDDFSFELEIDRETDVIFDRYKNSVLHMEVTKPNGDICGGSCFIIDNHKLVTCRHNIEHDNFKVVFDKDTLLDGNFFNIVMHPTADLAILSFKSPLMSNVINNFNPLKITNRPLRPGDRTITMGYPRIGQRVPTLLIDSGNLQNVTLDYTGQISYYTVSNQVSGGHSGGPILNGKGKVVAVLSETTTSDDNEGTSKYAHGIYINLIDEML